MARPGPQTGNASNGKSGVCGRAVCGRQLHPKLNIAESSILLFRIEFESEVDWEPWEKFVVRGNLSALAIIQIKIETKTLEQQLNIQQ